MEYQIDGWTIYWVGFAIVYVTSLFALVFTEDKECNISIPSCSIIAPIILSLTSWIEVIVLVGMFVREKLGR